MNQKDLAAGFTVIMRKNYLLLISLVLFPIIFNSCNFWKTDFNKAKELASSKNKNIMVLFSGETWNSDSAVFESNVLNKLSFYNEYNKDYVFVKIDFESSDSSLQSDTEIFKNNISEKYKVSQIPCLYILSPEGYYLDSISYLPFMTDLEAFKYEYGTHSEMLHNMNYFCDQVRNSTGKDKVYAIDALYESTPEAYRIPLNELIKTVKIYDSYNETALLGKYELISAYVDALEKAKENDIEGIYNEFIDLCTNGHLNSEQKQRAYYTAAFLLSSLESADFYTIIDLLQSSYNALPSGDNAQKVKEVLNSFMQIEYTVKNLNQEQ